MGLLHSSVGFGEIMNSPRALGLCKAPLVAVGLFILVLTLLPGLAVARCFGVPEGLKDAPGEDTWFLRLEVESATGFRELVTLGFHPNATDGFDRGYDQFAQPFDFRAGGEEFELIAYFSYPENDPAPGGIPENEPSSSRLRISTVEPNVDMAWPLNVAYLFDQDTEIEIRWNASEARDLEGFAVSLHTPFGEWIDMTEESGYSFNASLRIYQFIVDAHGEPGSLGDSDTLASDTIVLVGSLSAYGVVIAIVLGLRWMRKRQG